MVNKFMSIPNYDTMFLFCRLQLLVATFRHFRTLEPTNKILITVQKVGKPTNKKTLLENFGDSCNKQPNVPFLPGINSLINCLSTCSLMYKI